MLDSSVLPQAEGKGGVAQVDEAFRTATSVLIESESTCSSSINIISHDPKYETTEGLVDWNLEYSSTLCDLSDFAGMSSAQCSYEETMFSSWMPFDLFHAVDLTLDYDYMRAIDKFVSGKEKGERCDESSLPSPPSIVPETLHSLYGMPDHSPAKESLAMMHFGAQELEQPSVSLDFESQVESEPESLNLQSKLRISLAQPTPLDFTRVSSSSIESDHELQVVTRPQCPSVCSAHAKNMEIIRASLRRSFIRLDDGVERCVSDDVYAHAGEANHPISRVLSGYLHRTMTCVLWMR